MTTGQRIKAARKKAGMTQADLAEKLGIPYQSVSQWERDTRRPKIETLQRIAAALEVSIQELMDPEDIKRIIIYGDDTLEDKKLYGAAGMMARLHKLKEGGVTVFEDRALSPGRHETVEISAPELEAHGTSGGLTAEDLGLGGDDGITAEDLGLGGDGLDADGPRGRVKRLRTKTKPWKLDALPADPSQSIKLPPHVQDEISSEKLAILNKRWQKAIEKAIEETMQSVQECVVRINDDAAQKLVAYAQDLTRIPEYRRQDAIPLPPGQRGDTDTSSAPPEDTADTTPAEVPSEGQIQAITMICPICGVRFSALNGKKENRLCPACRRIYKDTFSGDK